MHFLYERPCLVAGCDTSGHLEAGSFDHAKVCVVRVCRKGHRVIQEVPLDDVSPGLAVQLNDRLLAGLIELGVIGGVE